MIEKVFSISEVTEQTGIKESTLRNWEREFRDYIKVSRDKHGSRIYTQTDIDRLVAIGMMRKKGLSLLAIKNSLDRLQNEVPNEASSQVATTIETALAPLTSDELQERMNLFSQEIRKIIREELREMFQEQSKEVGEILETRLERHRNQKRWWEFWK